MPDSMPNPQKVGECSVCGQVTSLLVDTDICVCCQRAHAVGFFKNRVGYPLLSLQKIWLAEVAKNLQELSDHEHSVDAQLKFLTLLSEGIPTLEGIINFVEAFQDCAADDLRLGEDVVFPPIDLEGGDGQ